MQTQRAEIGCSGWYYRHWEGVAYSAAQFASLQVRLSTTAFRRFQSVQICAICGSNRSRFEGLTTAEYTEFTDGNGLLLFSVLSLYRTDEDRRRFLGLVAELAERHGDWGRDGTMAVTTRHLGWRLVEVVRQMRGVKHAAAAQGIALAVGGDSLLEVPAFPPWGFRLVLRWRPLTQLTAGQLIGGPSKPCSVWASANLLDWVSIGEICSVASGGFELVDTTARTILAGFAERKRSLPWQVRTTGLNFLCRFP